MKTPLKGVSLSLSCLTHPRKTSQTYSPARFLWFSKTRKSRPTQRTTEFSRQQNSACKCCFMPLSGLFSPQLYIFKTNTWGRDCVHCWSALSSVAPGNTASAIVCLLTLLWPRSPVTLNLKRELFKKQTTPPTKAGLWWAEIWHAAFKELYLIFCLILKAKL